MIESPLWSGVCICQVREVERVGCYAQTVWLGFHTCHKQLHGRPSGVSLYVKDTHFSGSSRGLGGYPGHGTESACSRWGSFAFPSCRFLGEEGGGAEMSPGSPRLGVRQSGAAFKRQYVGGLVCPQGGQHRAGNTKSRPATPGFHCLASIFFCSKKSDGEGQEY